MPEPPTCGEDHPYNLLQFFRIFSCISVKIIGPRPLCLMLIKFSAYRARQSSVFFSFSSIISFKMRINGQIRIGWRLWHANPSFAQLIFLRKSDCLGCAVLLCLDIACFFLPSFSSLFKTCTCIYAQKKRTCRNCEEEESIYKELSSLSQYAHAYSVYVCVCMCVYECVYKLINYMYMYLSLQKLPTNFPPHKLKTGAGEQVRENLTLSHDIHEQTSLCHMTYMNKPHSVTCHTCTNLTLSHDIHVQTSLCHMTYVHVQTSLCHMTYMNKTET